MILTLFGVLVFIALFLIAIGLIIPSHSEQSLIGFALLFILGVIILNSTLEYESGSYVNSTYNYTAGQVTRTDQIISYQYTFFADTTSHQIGWALSIVSVIGFLGVIIGLRGGKRNEEQ